MPNEQVSAGTIYITQQEWAKKLEFLKRCTYKECKECSLYKGGCTHPQYPGRFVKPQRLEVEIDE